MISILKMIEILCFEMFRDILARLFIFVLVVDFISRFSKKTYDFLPSGDLIRTLPGFIIVCVTMSACIQISPSYFLLRCPSSLIGR